MKLSPRTALHTLGLCICDTSTSFEILHLHTSWSLANCNLMKPPPEGSYVEACHPDLGSHACGMEVSTSPLPGMLESSWSRMILASLYLQYLYFLERRKNKKYPDLGQQFVTCTFLSPLRAVLHYRLNLIRDQNMIEYASVYVDRVVDRVLLLEAHFA